MILLSLAIAFTFIQILFDSSKKQGERYAAKREQDRQRRMLREVAREHSRSKY